MLHGSGATLRELAGSLDGYTRVNAGQGKVRPTALKFFTGDFLSQVLNTVNPFSKTDKYTNLQCAEALLRIKDGVITGRPALVTQTERLNIFAAGKIDLKTENLYVDLNTVPQKGLGLSLSDLINPYTNIGGTLAKPTLTLDPQGAMIEGGVAVATGGISILAKRFAERYLTAADACGKAASDAEPEFRAIKDLLFSGKCYSSIDSMYAQGGVAPRWSVSDEAEVVRSPVALRCVSLDRSGQQGNRLSSYAHK